MDRITLYLSIYIPTILGPFITFIIGVVCLPFSSGWRSRGISPCSVLLLPGLILLHLSNYYINLVFADTQQNEFHYILVKYGLGFSFIILSPLLIIATQEQIRIGVKNTFQGRVLCNINTNKVKKKSVDFAENIEEVWSDSENSYSNPLKLIFKTSFATLSRTALKGHFKINTDEYICKIFSISKC